jgi:hypothetical protein
MAVRKGGRGDAGRAASHDTEAAAQLEAFCRGLRPILLEADVPAFRRYLAQWEDVIGSPAELSEETAEQTRQRMASMLRQPRRFGLPPWPPVPYRAAAAHEPVVDWPVAAGRTASLAPPHDAVAPHALRRAAAATEPADPDDAPAPPAPVPGPAASPLPRRFAGVGAAAQSDRIEAAEPAVNGDEDCDAQSEQVTAFQVDMLTGEMIPVDGPSRSAAAPARAQEPDGPQVPGPIRRKKRRDRRLPAGLTQLGFWSGQADEADEAGAAR